MEKQVSFLRYMFSIFFNQFIFMFDTLHSYYNVKRKNYTMLKICFASFIPVKDLQKCVEYFNMCLFTFRVFYENFLACLAKINCSFKRTEVL